MLLAPKHGLLHPTCFPETSFISVTSYQNHKVQPPTAPSADTFLGHQRGRQ